MLSVPNNPIEITTKALFLKVVVARNFILYISSYFIDTIFILGLSVYFFIYLIAWGQLMNLINRKLHLAVKIAHKILFKAIFVLNERVLRHYKE